MKDINVLWEECRTSVCYDYWYYINRQASKVKLQNKFCYILFIFIIDFASKRIMKGTKVTVIPLLQKRNVKLR
jgi:hypothetical protein